jgi:hypothetical protein
MYVGYHGLVVDCRVLSGMARLKHARSNGFRVLQCGYCGSMEVLSALVTWPAMSS